MDLSLRAYLRGWQFVFLDDVTCLNEIPGIRRVPQAAAQVELRPDAAVAESHGEHPKRARRDAEQKVYLVVFFFGTRMFATHVVSFFLYCVLIPICATAPEVAIPHWALVYMPVLVTFSTVFFTPGGLRRRRAVRPLRKRHERRQSHRHARGAPRVVERARMGRRPRSWESGSRNTPRRRTTTTEGGSSTTKGGARGRNDGKRRKRPRRWRGRCSPPPPPSRRGRSGRCTGRSARWRRCSSRAPRRRRRRARHVAVQRVLGDAGVRVPGVRAQQGTRGGRVMSGRARARTIRRSLDAPGSTRNGMVFPKRSTS